MSRRPASRRRFGRTSWAVSMAAALAVVGFIGAAQWNSSLARQEFVTSAQGVLINEAEQLQREQERLRAEIEEAEARVQSHQERGVGSQAELDRLNAQLETARLAAGLETVRGPGVVIEIADSLRTPVEGESPSNYIVQDADLRDIITALWASGAEAVTIGGGGTDGVPAERVVSTTTIYGAGPAILVNGWPLAPPYRIEAIGPEGLHERVLAHWVFLARVAQRIEAYGLQFASEPRDELTLSAFVGNTRLRWGAAVSEPD